MTLKQLEAAAGITDRASFWAPFARIRGTVTIAGRIRDKGFEAGAAQLRHMAQANAADREAAE